MIGHGTNFLFQTASRRRLLPAVRCLSSFGAGNGNAILLRRNGGLMKQSSAMRRSMHVLSSASNHFGQRSSSLGQLDQRVLWKSTAAAVEDEEEQEKEYITMQRSGVRNVAIIAHVDHGKTTLVDQLLKASSTDSKEQTEDRLMDCGELERERGITITSKVTRCDYRDTIVNIVDTPGHADFCGEVDRILSLVDGVCLVVDAAEGPMAQTKYVLSRALNLGLRPMVVLNKVDRADGWSRIESGETESELLDLFDTLGADENQLDYLTLYASARDGWVTDDYDVAESIAHGKIDNQSNEEIGMKSLLDRILDTIPEPAVHCYDGVNTAENGPVPGEAFKDDRFSLAAVTVGYDSYLGRTCTGRINSGSVKLSDEVTFLQRDGTQGDSSGVNGTATLAGIFVMRGTTRTALDAGEAFAGDIVTLAGVPDQMSVGDTLTGTAKPVTQPLPTPPLAPPTLSMEFSANNGPFAGQEGKEVTPSKIRSRLIAETDNNVTLNVKKSESDGEKTTVFARGELQLGILIEQMRREGYEIIISPPKIVTKVAEDGTLIEPFEDVTVDVDSEFAGLVVSSLTGDRKGTLVDMIESLDGKTRLRLEVPSRGLLGFHSSIATATKGTAVVNHVFLEDRKHVGMLGDGLEKGKLICTENGKATQYALASLAARGILFVGPGDKVYNGQVIGESAKQGDLDVNPVRAKAATNIRSQNKEEKVYLPPPKKMSIEELIGYMSTDEVLEVTPDSLRLRKAELNPVERKKASRVKKQQQDAHRGKSK